MSYDTSEKLQCDEYEINMLTTKINIISGSYKNDFNVKIHMSPPIHDRMRKLTDEFVRWCVDRGIIPALNTNNNSDGSIRISLETKQKS